MEKEDLKVNMRAIQWLLEEIKKLLEEIRDKP